jgi:hypothetical protein
VLPLNSVINPLIYDNELRRSIIDKFQLLVTSTANSNIIASLRERWQRRRENKIDGGIEMEPMKNTPQIQQDQDVIESAEDEVSDCYGIIPAEEDIVEDRC